MTDINTNDLFKSAGSKRMMKKEDRYELINYLFEHISDIKTASKKETARKISDGFKLEHPDLKVNENWIYRLLMGGIYCKNGEYGFESLDITVDEACEKPSKLEKEFKRE